MRLQIRRPLMAAVLFSLAIAGCKGGGGGSDSSSPPLIEPGNVPTTVRTWTPGTSWTYYVSNSANGSALTRTISILNPNLTNPNDQHAVLEVRDVAAGGSGSAVLNDYYFWQNPSTGSIYLEGIASAGAGGGTTPLWIKSTSGGTGSVLLYPSPMALGIAWNQPTRQGTTVTPLTITYSDNSTQTVAESVITGQAAAQVPIGPQGALVAVPSYTIVQSATSTQTGTAGNTVTDLRTTTTSFAPNIGIVQIQVVDTVTTQPKSGQSSTAVYTTTSVLTSTTVPH